MWRIIKNNILMLILSIPFFIYLLPNLFELIFNRTLNIKMEAIWQSFIASFIFLFFVFILIKPSLLISKLIVQNSMSNGESILRFKIVNISFFRAHDLNIYLYKVKRVNISGDDIVREMVAHFEGVKVGVPYLESAFSAMFESQKNNALQLKTNEQVKDEELISTLKNESSYLEIHISLKHGLSGLQGSFTRKYHSDNCIKKGVFEHGFSTNIT